MKWSALLLLIPFASNGQVNPAWVVTSNLVYTRVENSGNGMFGFEKGGKYGYLDKNGKELIPATLEFSSSSSKTIPSFSSGYANYFEGKNKGIMDKTGKKVIPALYYGVDYNASSNTFLITKYENFKYIYSIVNGENKVLIPEGYDYLYVDSILVYVKKDSKYGVLDLNGKQLVPVDKTALNTRARDKVIMYSKDGNWTVTDLKGNILFEKATAVYTLSSSTNSMIRCQVSGKYGYLDLKGNEAIATKYDMAYDFGSNGLAQVGKKIEGNSYSSEYLYGYVDKKGNEVVPLKYRILGSFYSGLSLTKDPETNRYGYLDKSGNWAIAPNFIEATSFADEGVAQAKMTDGKWHFINISGKDLGILNDKATTSTSMRDGYGVVYNSDQAYVLIDKSGKIIKTLPDCSGIYSFSEAMAGFKSAATSLYGFVDQNGTIIVQPNYTSFSAFTDGLAKVNKNVDGKNKAGYVNKKGEEVVSVDYDELNIYRNGWGSFKKDGTYSFINAKNQVSAAPRKYDNLQEFRSGMALGKVNGTNGKNSYYYINTDLKEVFNIEAQNAFSFWEDVAIILNDNLLSIINKKGETIKVLNGVQQLKFASEGTMGFKNTDKKWGFLDLKGNVLVPAIYDSVDSYKNDYAKVLAGTKWGLINKGGTLVIAPQYENIIPGENGIIVYYDNAWGALDKNGKILIPPTYNTLTAFEKDRALGKASASYTIIKAPR